MQDRPEISGRAVHPVCGLRRLPSTVGGNTSRMHVAAQPGQWT